MRMSYVELYNNQFRNLLEDCGEARGGGSDNGGGGGFGEGGSVLGFGSSVGSGRGRGGWASDAVAGEVVRVFFAGITPNATGLRV